MTIVRKSFLLSLADSYLALMLQIASTVVISRLLTPIEVGVFAIAATFAGLASVFRDFGVAEYLIQERDLTRQKIRATLALNIATSWAMALALTLAASPVADFYREPGVRNVMLVQALNFLLVPFGAVTLAWFRRELNYVPIVMCNALSSITSFVVAISLALSGFGYMSLAWSTFAGIAAAVTLSMWLRPASLPVLPSWRGVAEIFNFSKFASSVYIVEQVGKGAPELVIGRALGAAEVGIFSRGNGLVELVHRLLMRPVLQVCMPHFARSERDAGALVPSYLTSIGLLTSVAWPLLGLIALMAYPAIRMVYGEQWLAAVAFAPVLCLAVSLDVVHMLSREALMARGDARRANRLQMQIAAVQVTGLLVGVRWGLMGVAWSLVGAAAINLLLSQWHLRAAIGLRATQVSKTVLGSFVLSLLALAPLAALAWNWPVGEHNFGRWSATGAFLTLAAWLLGLRALKLPLWRELRAVAARSATRIAGWAGGRADPPA